MRDQLMVAIFVALGAALVAGLVLIPVIHEAQARSLTAVFRDKGQQGDFASGGKRQGGQNGGGGGCTTC